MTQHSYFASHRLTTLVAKNEAKNKTIADLNAKLKELNLSLGKAQRLTNEAQLEAIKEKNARCQLKESFEKNLAGAKSEMRAKLEAELRKQISHKAVESFKSSASFQACV